ncbi:LysR family transcriptional regulator [Janibacter limosus]|uniref:LysR family transcriptional regulator n=1 Tax=Janibacter limosus TaxID=53458 RepID=A0A4P6MSY3_9MICO|nr:LysR family transcriptional regulator [Janibacter limosus]QBF44797.1 LysR family transcriptional regulator [Janibacter limosus]
MVDAHRLRIFLSVMASGSVNAAAGHLGVSPSAVSQQVAALQKETGLTLFTRHGRGIGPTPAAHTLAQESERLMVELKRVDAVVDDLRDGGRVSCRSGYFASAGYRWMPQLAKRLQSKLPELTLQMVLTEGYPPGQAPPVDIDVVPDDPTTSVRPGYDVTPLMTDHFVALVHADHRLAGRRRVEMAELADDKWISNDISAGITQEMVDRACRAAGFRPRYTVEAQDHYTATAFVAAGVGITVIPDLAARTIPKTVRRLRLTNPNPVRDIVALTAPVARSNEAAKLAVDLLQQIAAASARRR